MDRRRNQQYPAHRRSGAPIAHIHGDLINDVVESDASHTGYLCFRPRLCKNSSRRRAIKYRPLRTLCIRLFFASEG